MMDSLAANISVNIYDYSQGYTQNVISATLTNSEIYFNFVSNICSPPGTREMGVRLFTYLHMAMIQWREEMREEDAKIKKGVQ